MAMLAGPRRKQKVINLRAKNSEWSNDANKFGQRMLEKMGWSSGKGLGANENGMVDHVIARYKNDEKGLGYEDKNDQWTKHEDDFNALLANLSNGDKDEIKLHSGVSLEVKSKKSKARVHYHKFTRGKDLTRYSEKDLANIFGKKTLKNKKNDEPTIVQEKTIKEEVKSEQVFTEKGSMEDYFKNKLAALKSKNISLSYEKEDYEDDYGFQGFLGAAESEDQQNVGFQGFSFCNNSKDNEHSNELVTAEPELRKTKKNKKSKKKNNDAEIQDNENTVELAENHSFENMEDEPQPAKKKKSKKNKDKSETIHEEKIKKKKYKIEPTAEEVPEEDCHIPKKKKKRKNKDDQ